MKLIRLFSDSISKLSFDPSFVYENMKSVFIKNNLHIGRDDFISLAHKDDAMFRSIVCDTKSVLTDKIYLKSFLDMVNNSEVNSSWLSKAMTKLKTLRDLQDFCKFFANYHSLESFEAVLRHANLNRFSRDFDFESMFRSCLPVNTDFLNVVLKYTNHLNLHQAKMSLYFKSAKVTPNDKTLCIIFQKFDFKDCEEIIQLLEWMRANVNFKPNDECVAAISALPFNFDSRNLVKYFLAFGLKFHPVALRPFLLFAESKMDCIKEFHKRYNLTVNDIDTCNLFVRRSLEQDPNADVFSLIKQFDEEFQVRPDDSIILSIAYIYIPLGKIPELCVVALELSKDIQIATPVLISKMFQNFFKCEAPERNVKLFLELLSPELCVSDALTCVSPRFNSEFLSLFKDHWLQRDDIDHLLMIFLTDLTEKDFANQNLVDAFFEADKAQIVRRLKNSKKAQNYAHYWQMLQLMNVGDGLAKQFLARAYVLLSRDSFRHLCYNSRGNYKEVAATFLMNK